MIKDLLCSLPLPVKVSISTLKTYLNNEKRDALKSIDQYVDDNYPKINTEEYKHNLKKFLAASLFNGKETKEYIKYLYMDKIEVFHDELIYENKPTIICVVKNEADKLGNFFEHYKKIGDFNYIFIDNGSTDDSINIIKKNNAKIYRCMEKFSTNRKVSWINKVYSTLPEGMWTVLLDADELLTYVGYENKSFNEVISNFERKNIITAGAVMIDMFSKEPVDRQEYINKYVYFENIFHEEKSFYFRSIYGGIREREFKFGDKRMFLIKKHPIVKKTSDSMLIHCHYIYPFKRNFESVTYFGLLHYKLFDSEIEKYRNIAKEQSYGNNSIEYKRYLKIFTEKSYADIFKSDQNTIYYEGSKSLEKIRCLNKMEDFNE